MYVSMYVCMYEEYGMNELYRVRIFVNRFQSLVSVKEQMRVDSQQLESCDWGGP